MKGLRNYLTPFAPDQSGAVAMCYALGGMVVIVDAGGCAGNICGFDEPRWQPDYLVFDQAHTEDLEGLSPEYPAQDPGTHPLQSVGAVFSAALRDMDAILGRDDLLVKKLIDTSKKIDVKFIALIGTPVPAVIGTDLQALARMTSKKTGLPCIAVSTDGMHLYDRGIDAALLELMKTFARDQKTPVKGTCGVLGLNPLDLFDPAWITAVRESLLSQGYREVFLHTMEGGLDTLERAGEAEINYVVSPAGLSCARYLEKRFGTPYQVTFPADPMILTQNCSMAMLKETLQTTTQTDDLLQTTTQTDDLPQTKTQTEDLLHTKTLPENTHILIVHQQVLANSIRTALEEEGIEGSITVSTWFDLRPELARSGDRKLTEEDDFVALANEQDWDLIIADPALRPMAKGYQGKWIDAFHFAVSGQAAIRMSQEKRASGTLSSMLS